MKRWLPWLAALLWSIAALPALSSSSSLQAPTVVVSAPDTDALPLTPYLDVLRDPGHQLTLADIQTPAQAARFVAAGNAGESLNLGFGDDAIWLRLTLRNDSTRALDRLLELGYARLGPIEFYQPDAAGVMQAVRTGITQPFSTRPYANRFFVFPLTVSAQSQQTVYLRVQSTSSLLIPAKLWSPARYRVYERRDYAAQAAYYGIMGTVLLFTWLMYRAARDAKLLLYLAFVASTAVTLAAENGLGDEFLWGDATRWSVISSMVGYTLSMALLLLFTRRLLDTPSWMPHTDRGIQVMAAVLLGAPLALAWSFSTFLLPYIALFVVMGLLILYVGIRGSWRRQRVAYFYLASFAMLAVGGLLYIFRTVGLIPSHFWTVRSLQIGSALQMLFLALALADRYRELLLANQAANAAALLAQRERLDALQSSEQTLERAVALRTQQLEQANQQLATLSTTDGLTGIANRRQFDDRLDQEWARAARAGQPLAVLMVDVDWFKKYNDHYGHPAGDECLKQIAHALSETASRSGDLAARYGGEEFAVIAPATSGPEALHLAQRMILTLQSLALPHALSEFGQVTISIGVSSLIPSPANSPQHLTKSADLALYRAKSLGRNQAAGLEPKTAADST